jgi:hypothetical protein
MSIFKKIGVWIKKLIGLGPLFVRNRSYIAVKVTEGLKNFLEGPYDNIIAATIPGSWAPELVRYLEAKVPEFTLKVAIAHNIIHLDMNDEESLLKLKELYKQLSEVDKHTYVAEFAGRMNYYLADGEISMAEGWNEAKEFYDMLFKNK